MCGLLIGLAAPGALAACSSTSSDPAPANPAPANPAPANPAPGGKGGGSTLAKLADIPVGSGKIVDGPSGKILLVRPTESEVQGLDPVCPHQGVTVGLPKGGTITCPGHGSKFDGSTGALKGGPATTGLTKIAVKVSGDSVVTA
jgi:nitrite reductase/ring-hydroxylating ferredoxin subunit